MADKDRVLHCWADRRACIEQRYGIGSQEWIDTWMDDWKSGTCMLERDHSGEHQFTDDDQIIVRFTADEEDDVDKADWQQTGGY